MQAEIAKLFVVVWHTAAIYLFLLVGVRTVGRRILGQLTVVDLVAVILVGSAVETSMVAANTSLAAGLVSASTLFLINAVLSKLVVRSDLARHFCTCESVVLMRDGQFLDGVLYRLGLSHTDIIEGVRARGITRLEDVKYAVLEADGEINVVPVGAKVGSMSAAAVKQVDHPKRRRRKSPK